MERRKCGTAEVATELAKFPNVDKSMCRFKYPMKMVGLGVVDDRPTRRGNFSVFTHASSSLPSYSFCFLKNIATNANCWNL